VHGAVSLRPTVVGSGRMGDGGPGRKRWMRSTGSENRLGGAGLRDIDLCTQGPGLLPHQKGEVEADPRVNLVVVVVVVAATPNYLRQASQNLGKYTLRT
jgi:hypothetical protein